MLILKANMQCPHVLLIKLGWRQDTALGRVEGRMMSGLCGVCSGAQNENIWLESNVYWTVHHYNS